MTRLANNGLASPDIVNQRLVVCSGGFLRKNAVVIGVLPIFKPRSAEGQV